MNMLNALELLQNYRQAESQIQARNEQMRLAQAQEERNALMAPLQRQAAQQNMLMQQRTYDDNQRYRNEMLASNERKTNAMLQMRSQALANRPKPAAPTIQTEDGIYERTPDGGLRQLTDPTTGKALKPKGAQKPMTEFQGKSSSYGTRAQNAHDILLDLDGKYEPAVLASKEALSKTPVIGGLANATANLMVSPETQKAEQAQRDFVNAVLRQESGATINPEEFDNAKKQYFPQPGDSKETIAQKRRNREIAIQGFERSAGEQGGEAIRMIREENAARRAQKESASLPEGWSVKEIKAK